MVAIFIPKECFGNDQAKREIIPACDVFFKNVRRAIDFMVFNRFIDKLFINLFWDEFWQKR